MTIAEDLAAQRERINEALADPTILDKRYLWAQLGSLNEAGGTTGGGGGTTTINAVPTPSPELAETIIGSGQSYAIPAIADSILELKIRFPTPQVCKLHLIKSNDLIGVFNFRQIGSAGTHGHILMADRSIQLPVRVPISCSLLNPNGSSLQVYLTYSKLV